MADYSCCCRKPISRSASIAMPPGPPAWGCRYYRQRIGAMLWRISATTITMPIMSHRLGGCDASSTKIPTMPTDTSCSDTIGSSWAIPKQPNAKPILRQPNASYPSPRNFIRVTSGRIACWNSLMARDQHPPHQLPVIACRESRPSRVKRHGRWTPRWNIRRLKSSRSPSSLAVSVRPSISTNINDSLTR